MNAVNLFSWANSILLAFLWHLSPNSKKLTKHMHGFTLDKLGYKPQATVNEC